MPQNVGVTSIVVTFFEVEVFELERLDVGARAEEVLETPPRALFSFLDVFHLLL